MLKLFDGAVDRFQPPYQHIYYGAATMAHIILFEHKNFHGAHKHVFGSEPNLNANDDLFFNDKVSSFVILEGKWMFFRDANYAGPASAVFGPGKYTWVEGLGIPNDSISALRPV